MSKEKGLAIISDKKYQEVSIYDVKKKNKEYGGYKKVELKYSKAQQSWTRPGGLACELESTGNNFVFRSYRVDGSLRSELVIDYDEAQELRALLNLQDTSNKKLHYVKVD